MDGCWYARHVPHERPCDGDNHCVCVVCVACCCLPCCNTSSMHSVSCAIVCSCACMAAADMCVGGGGGGGGDAHMHVRGEEDDEKTGMLSGDRWMYVTCVYVTVWSRCMCHALLRFVRMHLLVRHCMCVCHTECRMACTPQTWMCTIPNNSSPPRMTTSTAQECVLMR